MLLRCFGSFRGVVADPSMPLSRKNGAQRFYSSSPLLPQKVNTSTKPRRRKPQKQRTPSTTAETMTLAEAVEQGQQKLRLGAHIDSPTSTSNGIAASTTTSTSITRAVLKKDIAAREKELLQYFGRARHHYDTVPLHKAAAALQCASQTQACRVPFATLFPSQASPAPPLLSRATSSSSLHAVHITNTVNHNNATACHFSHDMTAFSAPNLFLGYDHKLNTFPDWTVSRALSNRYSNSVDANKFFGAREVPLHEIAKDTTEAWATLCRAWEAVLQQCATHCNVQDNFPLHHFVCFLVCYSQSQQAYPVARAMQTVVREALTRCRASRAAASSIFAVVPVYVGLNAPTAATTIRGASSLECTSRAACGSEVDNSSIEYPSGGLYTCATAVQCLARRGRHTCVLPSTVGGCEGRTYCLDAHIFVVSDAWLSVRNLVDVNSGFHGAARPSSLVTKDQQDGGNSSISFSESPNNHDEEMEKPPDIATQQSLSFIPEESRPYIHVFPGVISDRLSVKEQGSFGAYLWSMMQRVCRR